MLWSNGDRADLTTRSTFLFIVIFLMAPATFTAVTAALEGLAFFLVSNHDSNDQRNYCNQNNSYNNRCHIPYSSFNMLRHI